MGCCALLRTPSSAKRWSPPPHRLAASDFASRSRGKNSLLPSCASTIRRRRGRGGLAREAGEGVRSTPRNRHSGVVGRRPAHSSGAGASASIRQNRCTNIRSRQAYRRQVGARDPSRASSCGGNRECGPSRAQRPEPPGQAPRREPFGGSPSMPRSSSARWKAPRSMGPRRARLACRSARCPAMPPRPLASPDDRPRAPPPPRRTRTLRLLQARSSATSGCARASARACPGSRWSRCGACPASRRPPRP